MIVDEYCTLRDAKVYTDSSGKMWYCTLNMTNIENNNNKFYIIQLLSYGNGYHVYTRYGRVGDKGIASNGVYHTSEFHAVREFTRKFRSKTGETWRGTNPSEYTPKTGKYFVMDTVVPEVKVQDIKTPSDLNPHLVSTLELIGSRELMTSSMQKFHVDTEKLPLGKISKNQIDEGYDILDQISDWIDSDVEDLKEVGIENPTEYIEETLTVLSSRFWTFIPYNCGRNKPPVIKTREMIKNYADLLEVMENIKISDTIIQNNTNVDDIYEKLDVDIDYISPETEEASLIRKFVGNTIGNHGYGLEVLDIFSLSKEVQDPKNIFENSPDHRLLIHGSRMVNYVGILSEGLRIPFSNQVLNGSVLGKGIYFADCISKSFNYCQPSTTNNIGYIVLCEVALGTNPNIVNRATFDEKPSDDYTSRIAQGRNTPDPSEFQNIGDMVIPSGKLIPSGIDSGFLYNEYVIYDTRMYRFRYLLKIKMV